MPRAGVVIDPWKREIFERHLTQAGYAFTNGGLIADGLMVILIHTTDLHGVQRVLQQANTEAAIAKN